MKNITDLKVTQIRIFLVDVVPLSIITTKTCVEKVREVLSVGEVEVRPLIDGKNIIIFRRGELKKGTRAIVVDRIEVDPRRVIVEVEGTSDDGNIVYKSFVSALASAAKVDSESLRTPLLIAEATQCIITLDFAFNALLSKAFTKFLNQKVGKEASRNLAKASVRPLAIAAEITYEIIDKTLIDNKVTMNPKQFSIAPRPGAPSEARKYLISSPFDSDTHLRLIQELNKAIAVSR